MSIAPDESDDNTDETTPAAVPPDGTYQPGPSALAQPPGQAQPRRVRAPYP